MKNKSKNQSLFFRGTLIALALALTILCFPFNIVALVKADTISTDYNYMTIASVPNQTTTITKGAKYKIANAYIGGNNAAVVGKVAVDTKLNNGVEVTLKSSSVKVTYSSVTVGAIENGVESDGVTLSSDAGVIGTFDAVNEGSYTITYSYTYADTINNVEYTNKYSVIVTTEITSASISAVSNERYFLPSVLDLSLVKSTENFNVYIPLPEVKDEEGEVVSSDDYILEDNKSVAEADSTNNYLVVTAVASNGNKVDLEYDAEAKHYYFSSSIFDDANYGAVQYTITYAYYKEGNFLTSTTKTSKVYAKDNSYYKDYALKVELSSSMPTTLERGEFATLPTAKGVTASTSTPSSEDVDVYYTVKVYYKTVGGSYEVLNADEYNTAYNKANGITDATSEEFETIVNSDGTLVTPTKFKPMKDGAYSFVYKVTDFYGNSDENSIGLYEFTDVKDTTDPKPIVYDASESNEEVGYIDASTKLAYNVNPGEVVVYAIGMEDNVSKASDVGVVDKVSLERKIMSGETTTVVSIKSYNDKNLVFNYGNYDTLKVNNYLIRKGAASVASDVDMLTYLKNNNYMIVVDNQNYKHIYEVFENVVGEGKTPEQQLEYFKSDAAKTAGFAYIDMDATFGSKTAGTNGSLKTTEKGVGVGTFYIHYIATDAAENTQDISKYMYVNTYEDNEAPTIKFSTQLSGSYMNGKTITFNVPTATDTKDSRIMVKTLYRYVNGTIDDAGDVDFSDVYEDLTDADKTKYSAYNGEGYIDLTDTTATTYSIKIDSDTATKLQIVSYSYDDAGNVGVYAQTILISNVFDTNEPKFFGSEAVTYTDLAQGATVELPSIEVKDDKVSYLTPKVEVVYIDDSDNETTIPVYDTTPSWVVTGANGFGIYTLEGGKFDASYAGRYQARVAVKDYNNNTIVLFNNYKVDSRVVIQNPVISSTLSTSQEVEIDDNPVVEIPVPTINYELANSVIYDDKDSATDKDYIIRGIDADGRATNYTTNAPTTGDTFVPTAVGTYKVKYVATVEIYNRNVFTYQEDDYDTIGGFFKFGDHQVEYKDGEYLIDAVTTLFKNEDGQILLNYDGTEYIYNGTEFVTNDASETAITFNPADADLATANTWFNDLRVYKLESNVYTIEVKDTKGPKVSDSTFNYSDYVNGITVEEFTTNGIKLLPIQATDASGLDEEKSQIVVSWKRANGTASGYTGSKTYNKKNSLDPFGALENFKASEVSSTKYDGTYTITYTIYDKQGNYTTRAFTIPVGDNEGPTVSFGDGFVESSYELSDKPLVINSSLIKLSDNKSSKDNLTTTIKLVNTSKNNEEVAYTKEGDNYVFTKFDQVGTYELTVEVEDEVGNVTTKTFTIDVTEKKTNSAQTYKIVGIVLIVISVLILAGVIVYFIVSKVKLDKEIKKK